jgi:hypothetical protein
VTEEEIAKMTEDYIKFISDCLVDTGFTKDRLDEMYEDGYTVDEVMHEWEWENDSEMHEWSAKSKAQLKEKGYL